MLGEVADLLARSNRLGRERRITNYGGGNTSVKVTQPDPVTGTPVRVLYVKGSGGDLATLSRAGLATLVLDRVLALEAAYRDGVGEDDLAGRLGLCRFGDGGAVPSIDTPLHALVADAHVDHLHPDSVVALATSRDGAALVERCYGAEVGWLPWIRPGFELAVALRALRADRPEIRGAVLGGHGMICWAATSDECEELSLRLIARADEFITTEGSAVPFGAPRPDFVALPKAERRRQAAALAPVARAIAGSDQRVVGQLTDTPAVLEFLASDAAPRLVAAGTSCPDHFLRTKVKPLLLDTPASATAEDKAERLRVLHDEYRDEYRAYYRAHATADSPPMRGADPVIVLVPGVGMWSFGADLHATRVAGEFYVNAINVMRGAEAVSSYEPITDAERFRVEYWELEERKLRMRPAPKRLVGRVALVTGGASGIGRATCERLASAGACVVIADVDADAADKVVAEIGDDQAWALAMDVADEPSVVAGMAAAVLRFGGVDIVVNNAGLATAAPLTETTVEEWDRLHAVLSRGSFLVSREAAKVMAAQGSGGDIVYVVSKNAVAAGPSNVAYGAAKADQAHQVRLLAAELGPAGIRVNGVNPDGVVRGSGIFSGEWLESRAEAHGVEPEQLGSFYAERTLLGAEILPEHVAEAVAVLVEGGLARTTGLLVPVDGGLPEAFLR